MFFWALNHFSHFFIPPPLPPFGEKYATAQKSCLPLLSATTYSATVLQSRRYFARRGLALPRVRVHVETLM